MSRILLVAFAVLVALGSVVSRNAEAQCFQCPPDQGCAFASAGFWGCSQYWVQGPYGGYWQCTLQQTCAPASGGGGGDDGTGFKLPNAARPASEEDASLFAHVTVAYLFSLGDPAGLSSEVTAVPAHLEADALTADAAHNLLINSVGAGAIVGLSGGQALISGGPGSTRFHAADGDVISLHVLPGQGGASLTIRDARGQSLALLRDMASADVAILPVHFAGKRHAFVIRSKVLDNTVDNLNHLLQIQRTQANSTRSYEGPLDSNSSLLNREQPRTWGSLKVRYR